MFFLVFQKFGDNDAPDEKDSQDSASILPLGLPLYQNLLVNFLDTLAPVIGMSSKILFCYENAQFYHNNFNSLLFYNLWKIGSQ